MRNAQSKLFKGITEGRNEAQDEKNIYFTQISEQNANLYALSTVNLGGFFYFLAGVEKLLFVFAFFVVVARDGFKPNPGNLAGFGA